jgi:nucleotide-binding universal stress UspA family protein
MNRTLLDARRIAEQNGVPHVETHTGWGDATETILETAARTGADLIVVGRRGRGRLGGLLLGSVSQKIVTLAPCAVLVVP